MKPSTSASHYRAGLKILVQFFYAHYTGWGRIPAPASTNTTQAGGQFDPQFFMHVCKEGRVQEKVPEPMLVRNFLTGSASHYTGWGGISTPVLSARMHGGIGDGRVGHHRSVNLLPKPPHPFPPAYRQLIASLSLVCRGTGTAPEIYCDVI